MGPSTIFSTGSRVVAVVMAFSLLAASCGSGEDSTAKDNDESESKSKGSTPSSVEPTSSTSSTMVTTTTSPFGDTIDLSDAPPMVFVRNDSVYYSDDLSDFPELVVGPLESTDTYLVSPDFTMVAVGTAGDAVRAARVEIISIETGKALQTTEVDSDRVLFVSWAPNSEAVLINTDADPVTFDIDGTVETYTRTSGLTDVWGKGSEATKIVQCSRCVAVKSSEGDPTVLAFDRVDSTDVAGVLDPDSGKINRFSGRFGENQFTSIQGCNRATVLFTVVDGETYWAVFNADSGELVELDVQLLNRKCPTPSHDGKSVAASLEEGGTAVIDLDSGDAVEIARQGEPIAWAEDDSTVVVAGNGTFLVKPDGSGGNEASIEVGRHCVVGDTGKLVAQTSGADGVVELVLYDIDKDSAGLIGQRIGVNDECQFSDGWSWMYSGGLMVDLDNLEQTEVRRYTEDNQGLTGSLFGPVFTVAPGQPQN